MLVRKKGKKLNKKKTGKFIYEKIRLHIIFHIYKYFGFRAEWDPTCNDAE